MSEKNNEINKRMEKAQQNLEVAKDAAEEVIAELKSQNRLPDDENNQKNEKN